MTERKNMKKRALLLLVPLLVGIDQLTKWWAKSWLQENGPVDVIRGVFQFRYHTNKGAAWGMFQNRIIFFVIATVIAICVFAFVYYRIPNEKKYRPLQIITIFLLSGAVGNMIDRLAYRYVIDFLYIELIDFPIFNVADMYVSLTAFVLVYFVMFRYKEDDFSFLSLKKGKP